MRGWTALHYASLFAQPVAVKALLKAGAHPSSENTLGALLACFICLHSPFLALPYPVLCLLVSAATLHATSTKVLQPLCCPIAVSMSLFYVWPALLVDSSPGASVQP